MKTRQLGLGALVLAALFGALGLVVTTKMVLRLRHHHRNPPHSEP